MSRITELFGIKYPIVQGGMVWCSGWKLASAVSNAGGLGLIGAGSMHPEVLKEHVQKCKQATNLPFGVNLPLLYPQMDEIIEILIAEKVPVVFTSAGSPKKYTAQLKAAGMVVVHVIANTKFAKKCEEAGVDAIVAEGFEAGGHNGAEETTTMTLIPAIKKACNLPIIAAGGIGTGRGILAAISLGADGVQIGSRFAITEESSASQKFKEMVVGLKDGDTKLMMKKTVPVRLIKNKFFDEIQTAENNGAEANELREILGKGRAKLGMFEGDLDEGELEIGQVSAVIDSIQPVAEVVSNLVQEYNEALKKLHSL